MIHVGCRGEMIPNDDCFADLDPSVKDQWGIPVLRWHWKWGNHELNMIKHALRTYTQIFESMGGKPIRLIPDDPRKAIEHRGKVIHEV